MDKDTHKALSIIFSKYKLKSIILFIIILLSTFIEGLGFALIMPLLDIIIHTEKSIGMSNNIIKFLKIFVSNEYILLVVSVLFIVIVIFKNIFLVFNLGYSTYFSQSLCEYWSTKIKKQYLFGEYSFILNHKQGELIHNIIVEPMNAGGGIRSIIEFIAQVVLSITLISLLFLVNWKATLVLGVIFGIIILISLKTVTNYSNEFGKKRIKYKQNLNSQVSENISGIMQIKLFGLENLSFNKFLDTLKKFLRISIRFKIFKAFPSSLGEVLISILLISFLLIINYVFNKDLKSIIPIIAVFALVMQRLKQVLSQIVSSRMSVFSQIPSIILVEKLILKQEHENKKIVTNPSKNYISIDKLKNDIIFKDVTFGYISDHNIFKNLNLTFPKNKTIGIVGKSGTGKTTIINLITGLYYPDKGSIKINNIDIKEINLADWQKCIGVVSQDPFIFNTTIYENIKLGKLDAEEDEIINAAKISGAHDYIIKLKDGYNTVVGDRGAKLSGGQRQRIAIARSIVRDPDLLIFDEATSALDNKTESMVQKAIDMFSENKTKIIIAHRLSTLNNADIIYDLNKILEKEQNG